MPSSNIRITNIYITIYTIILDLLLAHALEDIQVFALTGNGRSRDLGRVVSLCIIDKSVVIREPRITL